MVTNMMIKQTLAGLAFAMTVGSAQATELPLVSDPVSAKVFLELHSIQQMAGVMEPLLTVPGEAFRVIEGDTVALGSLKIRLVGIDAPEMAQQCNGADGALWECAAEAEDRIRDLLRNAEQVECFSNDRDNYGHYIASCQADGQDVGAQLVAEGLAWPDQEQGYYRPEMEAARAESLGVWQADTPTPWEWRDQN